MSEQSTFVKKKYTGRVSRQQKIKLLEVMKANESVARGQYNQRSGRLLHIQIWKDLARTLNSMGGALKTPEQWKRAWIDWKAAVKKQYSKIRAFENRTGNLPSSEGPKPLQDLDKELIELFSQNLVDGDGTTPEIGLRFSVQTTSEMVADPEIQKIELLDAEASLESSAATAEETATPLERERSQALVLLQSGLEDIEAVEQIYTASLRLLNWKMKLGLRI